MGKSKAQQEVTEYRMSIHYGICSGPVDALFEVLVAEKSAWTGSLSALTSVDIDKKDLFGGVKKEGGVGGTMYYLPGEAEQLMPSRLAAKFNVPDGLGGTAVGTPETMPAYRGMAAAFFVEPAGASRKGFYWTANSPYLRGTWFTIGRGSVARGSLDGLSEEIARLYITAPSSEPGYTLGTGFIGGSHPGNWDTNNYVIAHIEQGKAASWNVATGARHDFPSPGSSLIDSGGCHVTDTGQTIFRTGGDFFGSTHTHLKFYNSTTFAEQQDLDIGPGENGGFAAGDILGNDGYEYLIMQIHYAGSGDWKRLRRPVGGSGWIDHATVPQVVPVDDMSVGPQYAYGQRSSTLRDGIILFDWHSMTETYVTPAVFAGRQMKAVTYIPGADEVFVLMDDADFLVFTPDLTTLKRSKTGNPAAIAVRSPICKRMLLNSSTILLVEAQTASPFYPIYLHYVNVETLEITSSFDIQNDTNFVNKDSPFTSSYMANHVAGGVLLFPLGEARYWPFVASQKFNSNPAHIIYETLLHPDWGMGASPSSIDKASFESAAAVLYAEGFGLSMLWLRQTTVEAFVQEILDHIEATLFINPRTGLLTLKLIRDDYDIDDLPIFDTTNSLITNFKRKLWGETINEIVVTWTNPANEQEETITVQDDANIVAQNGEIISDGRNYYGIRNSALATSVGYRDLRVASSPLATCDIEIDRSAWDLLPGDVCKIVSPDDGVSLMVMRVGPIDYGAIGSPQIKASLVEDVFSLATAEYSTPPGTAHEDTDEEPADAAFAEIITLPYYMAAKMLDAAPDVAYPTVYAGMLVAQTGLDTRAFELWGELTDPGGNIYEGELGERSILARGLLVDALVAEIETTFASWPALTLGVGPELSGFAVIGNGDETEDEIVFITSDDGVGGTINRGMLDTTPRDWPIGTPIWFIAPEDLIHDNTPRSAFEDVTYKALTKTSLGTLDPNAATPVTETLTERPHLPSRPANCQVNGVGFGLVNANGVNPIPITVSERNRLTEDAVVLAWDDATVTPEAGQTWQLVLMEQDRTPITTIAGLTGTSYDLDPAAFAGVGRAIIRFEAERDGLISLQGHEIEITVDTGYGYGYGYNYGGA